MTKMKLVPAEPTDEMVDVGDYYADKCFQAYAILPDSHGFYRTMISAAPNGGRVSREAVEKAAIAISGAPFPTSNSIRKAVAAFRAADLEVEGE